jgi:hypothetical protein
MEKTAAAAAAVPVTGIEAVHTLLQGRESIQAAHILMLPGKVMMAVTE